MKPTQYPLPGFKPLVRESFRKVTFKGSVYSRRIRINGFNALQIDQILGTQINHQYTKFVVLDSEDMQKVCEILEIVFNPEYRYYLHIDRDMQSFSKVP